MADLCQRLTGLMFDTRTAVRDGQHQHRVWVSSRVDHQTHDAATPWAAPLHRQAFVPTSLPVARTSHPRDPRPVVMQQCSLQCRVLIRRRGGGERDGRHSAYAAAEAPLSSPTEAELRLRHCFAVRPIGKMRDTENQYDPVIERIKNRNSLCRGLTISA